MNHWKHKGGKIFRFQNGNQKDGIGCFTQQDLYIYTDNMNIFFYLQWAHLHAPRMAGVGCAQLQAEGTKKDEKEWILQVMQLLT